MRALLLVALVALTTACDDQKLATPSVPTTPQTNRDGGTTGEDGGWGDPTTTRREGVLRIGHLNVRRYFDATCDSGKCEPGGFEEVVTQADFDSRTAQLAQGLARLEADVITLAEVENQASLDALRSKLEEAGFVYPVAYLAETAAAGSVDVGVLSRGTLGTVKTYRKETPLTREDGTKTQFTRELPEFHLTFGSNSVIVFAAHFRSKADDDPSRRLAEAKAAHDIIVAAGTANTGAVVLLGGDLNDVPGSDTIDALEKDGALVRVAKDLPEASQGTYSFGGTKQAIDHIFTTASRASAYVPKSATVVRDGTQGLAGSDHAAIYADFNLP
ncbi:MAG TPA: endonuclease/exonuclease/phosphatase family protein [Labilithrix sp.]|nr:endonuclease/exonuclease/phosphatase family protein [Labilithrix sp.]